MNNSAYEIAFSTKLYIDSVLVERRKKHVQTFIKTRTKGTNKVYTLKVTSMDTPYCTKDIIHSIIAEQFEEPLEIYKETPTTIEYYI